MICIHTCTRAASPLPATTARRQQPAPAQGPVAAAGTAHRPRRGWRWASLSEKKARRPAATPRDRAAPWTQNPPPSRDAHHHHRLGSPLTVSLCPAPPLPCIYRPPGQTSTPPCASPRLTTHILRKFHANRRLPTMHMSRRYAAGVPSCYQRSSTLLKTDS